MPNFIPDSVVAARMRAIFRAELAAHPDFYAGQTAAEVVAFLRVNPRAAPSYEYPEGEVLACRGEELGLNSVKLADVQDVLTGRED